MPYPDSLDTPVLVVDEAVLRRNVTEMAEYSRQRGIALRPHFKTHKTEAIARLQLEAGAVGLTCAKLGEAEALVDAGVANDLFIGYELVGAIKVARLARLMERAKIRVAVDSVAVAEGLNAGMAAAGRNLDVVIEIDTGHNRAGVASAMAALELAQMIRATMTNLRVIGVMTYEGQVNGAPNRKALAERATAAGHAIVATADLLRAQGFQVSVVSVGSTVAARETTRVDGITEMRPGTYVFNDATGFYLGIPEEACALRILTTVISCPAPDRAVIDAGSKALTSDLAPCRAGYGYIVEYPDAEIVRLTEEHGILRLANATTRLRVGDKLHVIPNHVCPSVNLTDQLYVICDDRVADTWPVIARGKVR